MKIGIIGYGNIGQLISKNLINWELVNKDDLYVSNRHSDKEIYSNEYIAKNSDKIIISVKSSDLINVLGQISPYIKEDAHIIHTCAGIDFNDIFKIYTKSVSCVIPTIASTFDVNKKKKGISIFYHNNQVSIEEKKFIEELFSNFSYVKEVDNIEDLEALTIATSCMPAFVAFAIDTFSKELSNRSNFTKEELNDFVSETVNASSLILKDEIYSSEELISKVATKNGITQKGLDYLEKTLPKECYELINKLSF